MDQVQNVMQKSVSLTACIILQNLMYVDFQVDVISTIPLLMICNVLENGQLLVKIELKSCMA